MFDPFDNVRYGFGCLSILKREVFDGKWKGCKEGWRGDLEVFELLQNDAIVDAASDVVCKTFQPQ